MRKTEVISQNFKRILPNQSTKWYLGKKVVSKSGAIIGKVSDIVLSDKGIHGLVFKHGFHSTCLDKQYIQDVSDAVILGIDPVTSLVGKLVFDADGRKLGKVTKVGRKGCSNLFVDLAVKKRFFSKELRIPKDHVAVMRKNVILNRAYD